MKKSVNIWIFYC